MSDIPVEMTEETVHEIAEAVPAFVESMAKVKIQFALLGAAIGAATAGLIAFKVAYLKAEKEADARADDEIAEMREHYVAKGRALEAEKGKGDLADLVQEKGYASPEPKTSASPPMAVQPPPSVVAAEDDSAMAVDDVEGANGVKARGEAAVRNVFRDNREAVPSAWDQQQELKRRNPDIPYVIHRDEVHSMDAYSDVSYTYYAADDVLCNERDEVVDPADRDDLVGEANLERFGHGSGDASIVFIRNDHLEIVYEIIRSPNSFAEEVHGFKHEGWDRGNLERMRRKERDEYT